MDYPVLQMIGVGLALVVVIVPLLLFAGALRMLRRAPELDGQDQLCGACGYPTRGLPSPVCPECGTHRRLVPPCSPGAQLDRPLWWLGVLLAYEPPALAACGLIFFSCNAAGIPARWLMPLTASLLVALPAVQVGMAIFWVLELRRIRSFQCHLIVFALSSMLVVLAGATAALRGLID
jgi:hypothetical protein